MKRMLGMLVIAAAVAIGLSACSTHDEQAQQSVAAQAPSPMSVPF